MSHGNGKVPHGPYANRTGLRTGVKDAIADFRDWCTDSVTGKMTPEAEDAYTATRLVLERKLGECACGALRMLEKLEDRNGPWRGCDIPEDHVRTNGPDFKETLGILRGALRERQRKVEERQAG
jgi:hypothetical protein